MYAVYATAMLEDTGELSTDRVEVITETQNLVSTIASFLYHN